MSEVGLSESAHEDKLQALLDAAPTAVLITDQDGMILLANRRALDMFGYRWAELKAESIECLLPERHRAIHLEHRARFVAAPAARPMGMGRELVGRRKDGTEFPVEVGLDVLPDGPRTHVIAFVSDISKRKLAEEALRQRTRELEARNQELDAFAHTVAHDLKNPLAILMGFTEFLEDEYETLSAGQVSEYLRRIVRIGRKMSNIIDELLLLAGVREVAVDLQPVDMGPVVAGALERLADMLQRYDAQLVQPESWPVALGYGPWLEEVWANYLSNAIKYGGRPPRIEVGAEALDNGFLRFWVQDNGHGLTDEEQERLFVPFTQLNQAHTSGHGLGLSIVRRIVERLGGQVAVESTGIPGEGTRFSFTLAAGEDTVAH